MKVQNNMIIQFIENHKKPLLIALVGLVIILIVGVGVLFALSPKDEPIDTAKVTSETPSSEPTSSVAIVVPEIKKPVKPQSSAPVSSEPVSSEPTSSALPVVDITASVDTKPTVSAPQSSTPASKPQTPPEGDLMPQPNPDYAKTANRNMPSFTVDTSVVGASGRYHGEFDGTQYYHAGLDSWVGDNTWYTLRFGQYPNATKSDIDYSNKYQFSPFQQDGDYSPRSSSYFCKACHGWVRETGWENGKHFDKNPSHQ